MSLSLEALSTGWELIYEKLMERTSAIEFLTSSLHDPPTEAKELSLTFSLHVYHLGIKTSDIRERLAWLLCDVSRKRAELSRAQIT